MLKLLSSLDSNNEVSKPVATLVEKRKPEQSVISTQETRQVLNVATNLLGLLQK